MGDTKYYLIEVERLRTGYCQLIWGLDLFGEGLDKTIKDAKINHLSTWMLVKDPALIQALSSVSGEAVLPVSLKIRHFGQESVLKVYNNLNMEDLVSRISLLT